MAQVQVTISDEEYSEMLQVRLAAKHGFDEGTVTYEEYMAARAVVRRARKVRKAEGAVVENYKQQSAPQHQAMTRKAPEDLVPLQWMEGSGYKAPEALVTVPARRTKQAPEAPVEAPEPTPAKVTTRRTRKAKVA